MKILFSDQIRQLDQYTITHEPVSSLALMERAAEKCTAELLQHPADLKHLYIVCGNGNNGGDGLVIARLLQEQKFKPQVYIIEAAEKSSSDFRANLKKLLKLKPHFIRAEKDFPQLNNSVTVIDAIFGSGLNRPVTGLSAKLIRHINQSGAKVISIDIPSGLFADKSNNPEDAIILSDITYTFHAPKLSFMWSENEKHLKDFKVLDISLDKDYSTSLPTPYEFINSDTLLKWIKERRKFSHKGDNGHALIIAGSSGKEGAAILATGAALHSGAGLVTAAITDSTLIPLLTRYPSAMTVNAGKEFIKALPDISSYDAIGIGPGLGKNEPTIRVVIKLLKQSKAPMVLDADAINILAADKLLLKLLPKNTILTPHPGEFRRLAGTWKNDAAKHQLQSSFAVKHSVIVILKGAHTSIALPDGRMYFNSTGNPGMAKGGSGDVLTGMLTAFLAQGYGPEAASVMAVFLHGAAGDELALVTGKLSLTAQAIIDFIPAVTRKYLP